MEKIINEIRSVKRWVKARTSHASCDLRQLEKSFADQVLKLVRKANLGPGDVVAVMEELGKDNPYGTFSKQIIEALDKHMFSAEGEEAPEAESSTKQMLKNWWMFLIAIEWAILMGPRKSIHTKMATCVHRARLLGIWNPDEQAVKWLLALIYKCHYAELPPPKQRFKQVNELKELFVSEQGSQHMTIPAGLRTYPGNAQDLPGSLYKAAYSADQPPEDRSGDMTGLAVITHGIPLRKTSKVPKGCVHDDDDDDDEFDETATKRVHRSPSVKRPARASTDRSSSSLQCSIVPVSKFCHACGRAHEPEGLRHTVAKWESPIKMEETIIKSEVEQDRIRANLRLNGRPLTPPVMKLEQVDIKDEEREPPILDDYALAATEALKNRIEKKRSRRGCKERSLEGWRHWHGQG